MQRFFVRLLKKTNFIKNELQKQEKNNLMKWRSWVWLSSCKDMIKTAFYAKMYTLLSVIQENLQQETNKVKITLCLTSTQ